MARTLTLTARLMLFALALTLGAGCDRDPVPDDYAPRDGNWGHATECKTIPDLEPLTDPYIVISVNGLTLRLADPATGFEKVYPVGVGAINEDPWGTTYGESLTYYPLLATGSQDFEIRPSDIQSCKIWWRDESGNSVPVFAGLPFLRWWGNYGIHGPITNYQQEDGGDLKRGYVSHGCIRMEAADILEVTALIWGVERVPVHVQREPERLDDGTVVDIDDPWLGAECETDEDCPFEDGFCKHNEVGGRGFCSARCDRYCDDRWGYPVSFCVDNPDDDDQGMCVLKEQDQNLGCRTGDHMVPETRSRFGEAWRTATVCVPGSPGWIGDRCQGDDDCGQGLSCLTDDAGELGVCTQACDRYCPDQPGWPWTYCASDNPTGGNTCVRECTPDSNGSECAAGFTCEPLEAAAYSSTKYACVPEFF